MWGARSGETLEQTLQAVKDWNKRAYGHAPTPGERRLTDYGYNWYEAWAQGDPLPALPALSVTFVAPIPLPVSLREGGEE